MSLHYSKSPSDPFSLRSNRCLWIHVVYPWSSPDGPWLLGPHWFLHLSWNMPSMLLPLQFVNPFLVLFFPKYHTLTLLFFSGLCSVSPYPTAACKMTSTPYTPTQQACSVPLSLLFSKNSFHHLTHIFVCLLIVFSLLPSYPCSQMLSFTKVETLFYSLLYPQSLEECLTHRVGTHEVLWIEWIDE